MKVVWNVPNLLTLLRVLATPLLAYFLLRAHYHYALYTFAAAALTDMLDGFVARHFNRATEFGAALDPLADKLITLTCLLILTFQTLVPLWLTLVMVVRDAVIVAGAFAYHQAWQTVYGCGVRAVYHSARQCRATHCDHELLADIFSACAGLGGGVVGAICVAVGEEGGA
jgi:CDP-diacylglycerol--glycerol-3-phosphate 3-phosphatidyltransferase